ncbi:DNA polymerase III subunit delta [Candidatus Calescamantes bacterium]|nr:DNA polymerase III subunit delta [Candidatus Calescamantes bacterium]
MRLTIKDIPEKVFQSKSKFILFWGEEEFFKEESLKRIRDKITSPLFNWKVLNGEEVNTRDILSYLISYPFFSSWKILVIKRGEKAPLSLLKGMKEILPRIPESVRIIVTTGKNKDKWEKFFPHINQIKFSPLKDNQIKVWIKETLEEEGKGIEEEALTLLFEMNAGNLYALHNEIEKLINYTEGRNTITVEDVERVTSEGKEVSLYHLILYLLLNDLPGAMKEWQRLRLEGVSPFSLIGLLTWELGRIGSFKQEVENRISPYSLFQKYRIWRKEWQKAYRNIAKTWSWKKIRDSYFLLQELDMRLKSGYSPSPLVEIFIYRFVRNQ